MLYVCLRNCGRRGVVKANLLEWLEWNKLTINMAFSHSTFRLYKHNLHISPYAQLSLSSQGSGSMGAESLKYNDVLNAFKVTAFNISTFSFERNACENGACLLVTIAAYIGLSKLKLN